MSAALSAGYVRRPGRGNGYAAVLRDRSRKVVWTCSHPHTAAKRGYGQLGALGCAEIELIQRAAESKP